MRPATQAALDQIDALIRSALLAGRSLTADERERVEDVLAKAETETSDDDYRQQIEHTRSSNSGAGFGGSLLKAGFDPKSQPSVTLSAYDALGRKAPTFPAAEDVAPIAAPGVANLGRDARFLWPALVRQNAGTNTGVLDFQQTTRAVTGSVERAIDATTEKATIDLGITHMVKPLRQLAVVVNNIPNAILEAAPLFRQFFDAEGRFAVDQALDAHCLAQIVAAAPPFGNAGTGLIEQVRNAVTAMRAEGANPSLLVVNAADAAALDLSTDAGGYVFPVRDSGSASPLWGVRVIERPGTTPPYLIDPQMLGLLYLGQMRIDADPYSGFTRNLTNLRVEVNALLHVRNARGARRIAGT